MRTITLNQTEIDKLFEEKTHQADILLSLYKMVFSDYDEIKKLHGFPHINRETSEYFFEKFINFDRAHHPGVLSGGLWMNNGFGTDDNIRKNFVVLTDESIIEYK